MRTRVGRRKSPSRRRSQRKAIAFLEWPALPTADTGGDMSRSAAKNHRHVEPSIDCEVRTSASHSRAERQAGPRGHLYGLRIRHRGTVRGDVEFRAGYRDDDRIGLEF